MRLHRTPPPDTLVVDDLTFALRWSARRASIGISVKRDGELTIAAPPRTRLATLETVARERLPWVRRKLAAFAALGPSTVAADLREGANLPYLGRRLQVARVAAGDPVRLRGGRLEVVAELDGGAPAAVEEWYLGRARTHLEARLAHYAPVVGVAPFDVVVRDIGRTRWGVCDCRRRIVSLHWQLVTLPRDVVDYVVVHELCHLLVPNHSPAFWDEVLRVLPDCRARRRRLTRVGRRLVL